MDPNPGQSSVVKYAFNQNSITKENIEKFVKDFTEGKILPLHKSEVTPTNRAPGLIMPLNSESFERVAMDRQLDVMVIFFTTNSCKLCEDLWPLYIQAAEKLKSHGTQELVFASVNMAQNELPDVHNLFYYPTLRFYPRDSKSRPYDFDGGLLLDDILKFIKRVASVPIPDMLLDSNQQKTGKPEDI